MNMNMMKMKSSISSTTHRQQQMRAMRGRTNRVAVNASASEGTEPDYRVRKTLPIFPLNVVALPATVVPLMIFEARYRVLFSTLLDGMAGIEEGLVQKDADWCGTKRFGMCFVDNEGRMATTGCTLEVEEFAPVPDGRLFIQNKGKERFRVIKVISEKPVMTCEVEVLKEESDEEVNSAETKALADQVSELLRNVIRLNVKMQNTIATDETLEPEELSKLGPRELSYWVASFFSDVKLLQQNLLEEGSTIKRLEKEKEVLDQTVKYYSAAAALKSLGLGESSAEAGSGEPRSGDSAPPSSSSQP